MRRITDQKAREFAQKYANTRPSCANLPCARERASGFVFALSVSAGLVLAFLLLFPKIDLGNAVPVKDTPFVFAEYMEEKHHDADIGMEELADYSALFLPTRRNHRMGYMAPKPPDGWDVNALRPQRLAIDLYDKGFADLGGFEDLESGKLSLTRSMLRHAFASMGIEKNAISPLSQRPDNVKLTNLDTGENAGEFRLDLAFELPSITIFSFTIYPDGTFPAPLTYISCGDEKIDDELRKSLTLAVSQKKLPEGNYRAVVSP